MHSNIFPWNRWKLYSEFLITFRKNITGNINERFFIILFIFIVTCAFRCYTPAINTISNFINANYIMPLASHIKSPCYMSALQWHNNDWHTPPFTKEKLLIYYPFKKQIQKNPWRKAHKQVKWPLFVYHFNSRSEMRVFFNGKLSHEQ